MDKTWRFLTVYIHYFIAFPPSLYFVWISFLFDHSAFFLFFTPPLSSLSFVFPSFTLVYVFPLFNFPHTFSMHLHANLRS